MITDWPAAHQLFTDNQAECLWQDLDGLHLAPAPEDSPHTSILWAWTPLGSGGPLWRVRLDGDTCCLAERQPDGQHGEPLLPWGEEQQIRDARRRARVSGAPDPVDITLHQVVSNIAGAVPIPFFYRVGP